DVSIAKDFFVIHLPQTIKPHCDFNTLKIQPTVFVDDDLKHHVADVLYSIQIKVCDPLTPGYSIHCFHG
ncbi:MAG: Rpn family recombination-promoting nuclease/putative transposase, partial [Proteobacteria bacterium]|nr:Rpn family recombination-promoting nuclease/putative transposase [Pseudomonadota bacterium]